MGPEAAIERKVSAWAKKQGILPMKLAGPNQKGQPDHMFLHKGKVVFIEFKAFKKRPTPLQEHWLEKLTKQGFYAQWCDSADQAIACLSLYLLGTFEP